MAVQELCAAGVEYMAEGAIEDFLRNQRTGVLGLPGERAPYLLPMCYGYDVDRLYFSFFLGPESRKERLAETAPSACFLVYRVDSKFTWQSVLLEGDLTPLSEDEWRGPDDVLADTWRPPLFDAERFSRGATVYAFDVAERTGLRHTGLPPGLRRGGESKHERSESEPKPWGSEPGWSSPGGRNRSEAVVEGGLEVTTDPQ